MKKIEFRAPPKHRQMAKDIAKNRGVSDAVIDGETGYLVRECDTEGFLRKIKGMRLKKEHVRAIVNSTFDWQKIYKQYLDVMVKL